MMLKSGFQECGPSIKYIFGGLRSLGAGPLAYACLVCHVDGNFERELIVKARHKAQRADQGLGKLGGLVCCCGFW